MRFFNRLGATEVDPDSVCNLAGHIALDYVYGTSLTGFDPRTAKDSECVFVWGGNPSTAGPHTNQHWLTPMADKLVVIDPIRTPTAAMASLHLQPIPGSDAALAFSIMHVIEKEGLLDTDFLDANSIGWEQLRQHIEHCTPDWGERHTGVPAAAIVEAARRYAGGPLIALDGAGIPTATQGRQRDARLCDVARDHRQYRQTGAGFLYLNGLNQRNIDDQYLLGSHLNKSPNSISHMDLAAALENPERASALFCWNVNNVASSPEQTRLRKALQRDDLLTVVVDVFPTDTSDYADYVLPAANFLESDDLFASYFDLTLSAQVKVAEPMGEALPNSEIFRRLAKQMEFEEPELYESDNNIIATLLDQSGLDETFDSLKAKGTVPVSANPVIQFESLSFPTPSGKIELASQHAHDDGLPLTPDTALRSGTARQSFAATYTCVCVVT